MESDYEIRSNARKLIWMTSGRLSSVFFQCRKSPTSVGAFIVGGQLVACTAESAADLRFAVCFSIALHHKPNSEQLASRG